MKLPTTTENLSARFWSKVRKGEGDACWIWVGASSHNGYGGIRIQGRLRKAHRVSYEMTHGPIGEEAMVLHRCDNPPCVRPDHLFVGTQADNMNDMYLKGRGRSTEADTRERIAALVADGMSHRKAAEAVGVNRATVDRIIRRSRGLDARAGGVR